MPEPPVLSNPSIGDGDVVSVVPATYAVDVYDPDRASGAGDFIKEAILRMWRKVDGSYRYLGAKRKTIAPLPGTDVQRVGVNVFYEPSEVGSVLWLEGTSDVLLEPNDASNVSLWRDRSGNLNHAYQSSATNRPTPNATDEYSQFRSLVFDTNDFMNIDLGSIPQPFTVFAEVRFNTTGVVEQTILSSETGSLRLYIQSDGRLAMNAGTNLTTAPLANGSRIITAIFNGASSSLRQFGSVLASGNAGTNGINDLIIGANNAFTNFMNDKIVAIMIVPRVMTTTEIEAVEGYLAKTSLLQVFPAGHPGNSSVANRPYYFDDPWAMSDLTPGVLSGWWEADKITGLVNNDPVGTWADSSGFGRNGVNTLTARPTYKSPGVVAGMPSVDFDGTNDSLPTSLPATSLTEMIFAVIKPDTVSGNRAILGASATNGRTLRISSGKLQVTKQGVGNFNVGTAASITAGVVSIVSVEITATQTKYAINGTQETVAHSQTLSGAATSIIGASSTGEYFDGEILALFSIPITSINFNGNVRPLIEGALAWKYGIQSSLPSNHAYRQWRPQFPEKATRDYAWTMEVRDAIGGIDGTGIFGRDDETLGPDGSTDFSVATGPYIGVTSLDSRMMNRIPRSPVAFTAWSPFYVSMASIQARLLKKSESGEYVVVATSALQVGPYIPNQIFSLNWKDLQLPTLDWSSSYGIQWQAIDVNGYSTGWGEISYFTTDASPYRPIVSLPESGDVFSGYPLVLFSTSDLDDLSGAVPTEFLPLTYVAQAGTPGSTANGVFQFPAAVAEDTSGNIYIVNSRGAYTALDIQSFTSSLVFSSRVTITYGSAAGQLQSPGSMTVDPSNTYLIIGDYGNNYVHRFVRSGMTYSTRLYLGVNKTAYDMAWIGSDLYIVTGPGAAIFKTTSALASFTQYAASYSMSFTNIAANESLNRLYCMDRAIQMVVAYDAATMTELFSFSIRAGDTDYLDAQMGDYEMTVDQKTGVIFIADRKRRIVMTFDAEGNFIENWLFPLTNTGNMYIDGFYDIIVSRNGSYLYVIDNPQSKVKKFSFDSNASIAAASALSGEVEISFPITLDGTYTGSASATGNAGGGSTVTFGWVLTPAHSAGGSFQANVTVIGLGDPPTIYPFGVGNQINAVGGEMYSLEYWASSNSPLAELVPVIEWFDVNGNSLGIDGPSRTGAGRFLPYSTLNNFARDFMSVQAPARAVKALPKIIINALGASTPLTIYIDDAVFGGSARFLRRATNVAEGVFSFQTTSTELPADGTYKIRTRGINITQNGPWTDQLVVQKVVGPTVVIDSPASGQVFQSVSPLILWRVTSGSQWAFQVQIYNAATLALAYDSGWVQSTSARSFLPPPGYLEDGESYFLRMGIDDGTIKVIV